MNPREQINFNPQQDRLGFAGDLVNRGPDSLAVLRFVKNLKDPLVVLGNHDFYLLAIGYGAVEYHGGHTLQPILAAPDKMELLDWLRHQPLTLYLREFDALIVHAGIPPQWSLEAVLENAEEAVKKLHEPDFLDYLREFVHHRSAFQQWNEGLTGVERIRYIINAFTHLRFCSADGTLDLTSKATLSPDPENFRPWYEWYRLSQSVLFGHWAALEGRLANTRCHALDTGCVWGGSLTAYRLEDSKRFSTPALNAK